MENRQKIEIAIAVAVLLGLVLLLFFLLRKPAEPVVDDITVPVADTTPDVPQVDSEDIPTNNVVSAQTVARNFVERFGSFSSDSDYLNVDDVLSLATRQLQARLQRLANDAREGASESYYGISTKAIIFTVEEESDAAMALRITTQREESIDSPANTSVRTQDIRLALVKDGDDWLIDDFTWLE